MTEEIVWQEPPAAGRDGERWSVVAADLKARPGEWALVSRATSNGDAHRIRSGTIKAFAPSGTFEAVSRSTGERTKGGSPKLDTYARYVGEVSA